MICYEQLFDEFIGSGAAITLISILYFIITRGRVKIINRFDVPHSDEGYKRHRIRIKNKGFKTLQDLTCLITFSNLKKEDINDKNKLYFLSKSSFKEIKDEPIPWVDGKVERNLHPRQTKEIDIVHYIINEKAINILSEKHTDKYRAKIININKEYYLTLKLCAFNYNPNKKYKFIIRYDESINDIKIIRVKSLIKKAFFLFKR